jgi:hypothetical protein
MTVPVFATPYVGEPDIPPGLTISECRRSRPRHIPWWRRILLGARPDVPPARGRSWSAGGKAAWSPPPEAAEKIAAQRIHAAPTGISNLARSESGDHAGVTRSLIRAVPFPLTTLRGRCQRPPRE